MTRKDDQGRPYLEATIAGLADIIHSEGYLENVRVEAGKPDMTLREAAVWMVQYMFPERLGEPRRLSDG